MKTVDFLVFGNNVSAMVSAIELVKGGNSVVLVNSTPNWGAHFSGIKLENNRFDFGMNYLEFSTFNERKENILEYNPNIRNHVGHFCHLVGAYVKSHIKVHKASIPQMLLNGNIVADIVMSNQFDFLGSLSPDTKMRIKEELRSILSGSDRHLHASNKTKEANRFVEHTYEEVSLANHGKTFHNLIVEPICKKILNLSSSSIPALFHRVAWAPLFYPETLLEALETGKTNLQETVFYFPAEGSLGDFIDSLENSFAGCSRLEVFRDKTSSLVYRDGNYIWNNKIEAERLVWTGDQAQLLGMLENFTDQHAYQKASISLGFCTVETSKLHKQFSTLYILNTNNPLYRITNQTFSAGKRDDGLSLINVEFNSDNLIASGFDTDKKVRDLVLKTFVENNFISDKKSLKILEIKHLKNVLNAPTIHNLSNFNELHQKLTKNYPGINLIGSASGFVSTSFNDHVVQGLKIGNLFKRDKIS